MGDEEAVGPSARETKRPLDDRHGRRRGLVTIEKGDEEH